MTNKDFKHNCKRCERRFFTSREDAQYCSNACRMAASRERKAAQSRSRRFAEQTRSAPVEMSTAQWKPNPREEKYKLLAVVNGRVVDVYPIFNNAGNYMPFDAKPGYYLFMTAKGQKVALPGEEIKAAQSKS